MYFGKIIAKFEISKIKKKGVHIREFDGNYENAKFQKDASIFAVFKAVYNGKGVTLFFDLQFLEVLGIVEEKCLHI